MAELLKDVREEVTGHVSIAAATHCVSPVIDAALVRFHRENPKATLSIKIVTSGDVVTLVKRKAASCGIGLSTATAPGLVYDWIYRENFALYCGRTSALFGREDVSLEEVIAQPYVTFPTDEPGAEMAFFSHARQKIGFDQPPVGRSYHLEELRRMIEIGIGIGPFPVHVAQPLVERGRLWQVPCFKELPEFEVSLITNPRTRRNAAEAAFIEILLDEIATTPIEERCYFQENQPDPGS
jgi:DNA-binding transcriptional LysR family regulator